MYYNLPLVLFVIELFIPSLCALSAKYNTT